MLNYPCFKENYKMITIDLSKHKVLDVDPEPIQEISFTGNQDYAGNTTIFSILTEIKETILNYFELL